MNIKAMDFIIDYLQISRFKWLVKRNLQRIEYYILILICMVFILIIYFSLFSWMWYYNVLVFIKLIDCIIINIGWLKSKQLVKCSIVLKSCLRN